MSRHREFLGRSSLRQAHQPSTVLNQGSPQARWTKTGGWESACTLNAIVGPSREIVFVMYHLSPFSRYYLPFQRTSPNLTELQRWRCHPDLKQEAFRIWQSPQEMKKAQCDFLFIRFVREGGTVYPSIQISQFKASD